MKAKSIKGKSTEEIRDALQQSMADAHLPDGQGFQPTLAFVFVSIKQDREAICEMLHDAGIDILGATSSGEFIDGYQGEGSTVILLLDLSREYYTILFEDIGDRELNEVTTALARTASQRFEKPAFILCSTGSSVDGEFLDGNGLAQSLVAAIGPQVHIHGGMAGDDVTFTGTYVFTYGRSTDYGVAALVLDEEHVSLHGMAVSGWKPIGISRKVTKSEDGWIYTIDDQPALDMYLRYLGKSPAAGEDKYVMFLEIGIHYPFQAEGIGDPVMRTPVLIDKEKKAIKLDFDIPQGATFRFSVPPDFDIVDNVIASAKGLRNANDADADALLIFSCAGRLNSLGPMTTLENEGLHKIWNAPMAGFFSYGEYGKSLDGNHKFHSTTCSWVTLTERS
jgi:hypothetical protein